MKYAYQSQKLSEARRALMLPHRRGEAGSIASAFAACSLGFNNFDAAGLDHEAQRWVAKIKVFMDTTGIEDPAGRGLWEIKAERMDDEEKMELARAVDELAHYFHRHFWSGR